MTSPIRDRWLRRGALLACCALLPTAVACVTQGRYDLMTAQRDALEGARARHEKKIEHLEAAQVSLESERDQLLDEFEDQRIAARRLESDVRRLAHSETQLAQNLEQTSALLEHREAEISAMRGTYDALVGDLQEEVAAGQIEIERLNSGLNLNLSQEVLFGNASAQLRPDGVAVLGKLAARLSQISYQVEIIGHTDDIPIGLSYPSNWELAGARASSVVRLLADAGVDPARMSAVSRGEFDPVASNETAEGRALNRRIEIRLTPNQDEPTSDEEPTAPERAAVPAPEAELAPAPEPLTDEARTEPVSPEPVAAPAAEDPQSVAPHEAESHAPEP